jgi:hypothetical protein
MQVRFLLRVTLFAAFMCGLALYGAARAQTSSTLKPAAQTVKGDALSAGRRDGVADTPSGTRPSAATGVIETRSTAAPRRFGYMMVRWSASVPEGANVELEARVSIDGRTWSDWGEVHEDHDASDPKREPNTAWSTVIYTGDSRYWQIRTTLTSSPAGAAPELREIQVNTVDARTGGKEAKPSSDTPDANERPSFVSRASWGGSEVLNNSVSATWYRADHLVVHHSADANALRSGESAWSDRVRAIWSFHAYSRGWGDVGYNWLVDPNGVIYEGRNGSSSLDKDSVGFHDTGNKGSMGVVMLGTFGPGVPNVSPIVPTNAAQNAVVQLLAWKANQRGIDPLGRSFYYGCSISNYCAPFNSGSVVPNIAGHRQVTPGHTSCPGDLAMGTLDSIRARVRDALRGDPPPPPPDNGDLTIDDREAGFSRSSNNWHDSACGFGGATYWTYATDGPTENWGRWRPNIPTTGRYRVYAYRPQECGDVSGQAITSQAHYRVEHANGATTVIRDQNTSSEWIDLGAYQFNAGSTGNVYLDDATGEPYSTRRVILFDAMRWVPESAPQPTTPPAPTSTPRPTSTAQPTPTPVVARAELTNVTYSQTTLDAGGVLAVHFTIRNTGNLALDTQSPPAGRTNDLAVGHVYDENECYRGNAAGSPAFPNETARVRVVLTGVEGSTMLGADCSGDHGGYPWRWGIDGTLRPGETRTVVGYVRFNNNTNIARVLKVRPALVSENVQFFTSISTETTVTVNGERRAPEISSIDDARGNPQASVYGLKPMPVSLLQRSLDPSAVVEGDFLGTFSWDGTAQAWGDGGPFGVRDNFVVRQVRPFIAPTSGTYTFETASDDGSWLWVDGQSVVENYGTHPTQSQSGSIWLAEGLHVLSVKYFDSGGGAYVRYRWMPPGANTWTNIPSLVTLSAGRRGLTWGAGEQTAVVADDIGGLGVKQIEYRVNDEPTRTQSGSILRLSLPDGYNTVSYRAVDRGGTWSEEYSILVRVDTEPPRTLFTAATLSNGLIRIEWTSSDDAELYEVQSFDIAANRWTTIGRTTQSERLFFGTPGRSYTFRVRAFDGLNWESYSSATTSVQTVPPSARFHRSTLPMLGN